ncbi:NADH-cytochrome b5 reductase-like [Culex pipiens pallens]|uniref:NADH-cytochrome b5 reductase-like n=1 Tax=Culex pipiens pallens TaxID=42434 RepID=UPI001953B0CB|nr:NADH-cytochrome b5 reductase-like [Culex pipiens pallens]
MDVNLPECCGSGCTNCVLDRKTAKPPTSAAPNILDNSYRTFQVASIAKCTANTFLFRFRYAGSHADSDRQLAIPPGSHLMLRAERGFRDARRPVAKIFEQWRCGKRGIEVRPRGHITRVEKYDKAERDLYFSRPYTPLRVDRDGKAFEVLVKLETGGEMSEYFTTLDVGVVTEWKGVYGGFSWVRDRWKNFVGFGQGVGLAPIYSIMAGVLDDEEDETRLNLQYCCSDLDGVLMRSELQAMAKYWNFGYSIYLSRESCSCEGKLARSCKCLSSRIKYNEPIFNHRLEEVDIENVLKKLVNGSFHVLICGNESFTKFVESCVTRLGISDYYKF